MKVYERERNLTEDGGQVASVHFGKAFDPKNRSQDRLEEDGVTDRLRHVIRVELSPRITQDSASPNAQPTALYPTDLQCNSADPAHS